MKKIILTTVLVSVFFTSTTFADQSGGPSVLPVDDSSPFGQSYQNWVADFSQWVYSIPSSSNPFVAGNLNCTQPQHGFVWFVGAATNTSKKPYKKSEVKCEVPEGKAIFLHVGAYIDTWPCPDPNFGPATGQTLEDFLTLDAKGVVDYYTNVAQIMPNGLTIDGQVVLSKTDALNQRVSSELFTLTGDSSLTAVLDSCVTGKPQKAVADGYWAMIVGLSLGSHTFTFTDGSSMKVTIVQ